ncbi:hypothetical protein GCM10010523_08550 [Paenarthrobacter ilicis]
MDSGHQAFIDKLHERFDAAEKIFPGRGDHAGQECRGAGAVQEIGRLARRIFVSSGEVPAIAAVAVDVNESRQKETAARDPQAHGATESFMGIGIKTLCRTCISDPVAFQGQQAIFHHLAIADQRSLDDLVAWR